MNGSMIVVTLLGGICIAVQAAVNGGLGKKIGTIEGAFVSFGIGTLGLLFAVILIGKGNIFNVVYVPKWQLAGGLLGAVYIFIMILAVPKIGVASAVLAVITGQILTSMVIDHFGWFGGQVIPINGTRISALLLMILSLYLFYKG